VLEPVKILFYILNGACLVRQLVGLFKNLTFAPIVPLTSTGKHII
jgi:hypothetical protein